MPDDGRLPVEVEEIDIARLTAGRRLSRTETHDLGMIIKDRTKVLRSHAEEQAAAYERDFERQLAAAYTWDEDEVWQKARDQALEAAQKAQREIEARCKELGIPARFAPGLTLSWHGRGENALSARRMELRRVAKSAIAAMTKAAVTRIEKQALALRTQVVAMGVLSEEARVFLESLAPIDDAMSGIDFAEMERRLDVDAEHRRRVIGHYSGEG